MIMYNAKLNINCLYTLNMPRCIHIIISKRRQCLIGHKSDIGNTICRSCFRCSTHHDSANCPEDYNYKGDWKSGTILDPASISKIHCHPVPQRRQLINVVSNESDATDDSSSSSEESIDSSSSSSSSSSEESITPELLKMSWSEDSEDLSDSFVESEAESMDCCDNASYSASDESSGDRSFNDSDVDSDDEF
jgi:hypothetical protein